MHLRDRRPYQHWVLGPSVPIWDNRRDNAKDSTPQTAEATLPAEAPQGPSTTSDAQENAQPSWD